MNYYVDCWRKRKLGGRDINPDLRVYALTESDAVTVSDALWATGQYDQFGVYDIGGHRIHGRWKVPRSDAQTAPPLSVHP